MSLIWPGMLLLLLLVPLLVGGYVVLYRRRAGTATSLGAVDLSPTDARGRLGRRRHVPAVIFLAALTLLLFGMSRPEVALDLPRLEGTVILAFDTSNSMRADDVEPTRLDVAKQAARAFVEEQPDTIRVGVVSFSNGGVTLQPPTDVQDDILRAIERVDTGGGTSLGQGIFAALNAIAGTPISLEGAVTGEGEDAVVDPSVVEVGYFGSSVIILLTDGEDTVGPDPLAIAQVASNAGVRIFSIGIGAPGGTVIDIDGFSVATELDEALLIKIAETTEGTYSHASDKGDLAALYDGVDRELTLRGEQTEVTSLFAGGGLLLLLLGAVLSMTWFGRMP